jgi:L-fucose/D-arabinose isomerase
LKSTTKKTWLNQYPKIGLRPTIDGRYGGVRESLEGQTMAMAERAAAFLTANLKYPDGTPVQVIINSTCIGGVQESAECEDLFSRENVGVSITLTPCWCYGSETMDMHPSRPKAVWGFNGTERPGAVYLAAVLAGHTQKGIPAFGIYGHDVQDASDTSIPADVQEKLLRFSKAALAVALMKGKSYLSMGGCSMGIAGSIVDQSFFESYLGMRVEAIDLTEIHRRIRDNIFDPEEYTRAMAWVKANCPEGRDPNKKVQRSRQQLDNEWETSVKMTLIASDLMVGNDKLKDMGFIEESRGHNAILSGFQGQRHWTDSYANGDFMEAISNTSFDWNGIRMPRLVATENDCLNGVAMMLGYLVTNTAQVFADVRTYWSPEAVKRVTGHDLQGLAKGGIIHLINSGSASLDGSGQQKNAKGEPVMKPFWEVKESEVKDCLKATTWHPSITSYFPGGGMSSKFVTAGNMPITMARVNLVKGLGPVLQIAEGYTVSLPADVHQKLDDRTNDTWPTTWFAPRVTGHGAFTDVYSVMNNWGANHGAFSYGHIGADLITLASLLRMPVFMHNVEPSKVFRPSAWASFGTDQLEGADFRACENYGPLYGNK